MNILYVRWNSFCADDLGKILIKLGHNVEEIVLTEDAEVTVEYGFVNEIVKKIRDTKAELVVSFNYFPAISVACMQAGCRYFSWIYDSPYVKAYDSTIINNVNYIGTFDSYMAEELNKRGVSTIHYVPLAINIDRIQNTIAISESTSINNELHHKACNGQIAFVGSLYNNRNKFYERLISKSKDMEFIGYLDGIIDAQRRIMGYNFLDECLDDNALNKIKKYMPYIMSEGSYIDESRIYADYYLAPRIAFLDRSEILSVMSRYFKVDLYTDSDYKIDGVNNHGSIDYNEDMPVIFNQTKINLNISLRSIRTGIPLRAMDIMGAGGFLLTNYQEDMFRHFESGKHFEYYTSIEEAVDKAKYYLTHETERSRICAAAFEEMKKNHTLEVRLKTVLSELISY